MEDSTASHPPRYLSTAAAADLLGVDPQTIRMLLGEPDGLHGITVGRVIRVDAASIEAYRAANVYTGPRPRTP